MKNSLTRLCAAASYAALILGLAPLLAWAHGPKSDDPHATHSVTPTAALRRLVGGNRRFVAGGMSHENQGNSRRTELVAGQAPFAIVLSCSDSRVPPEVIFDQGLGDLFIVRNAGNVAGTNELGSIQYAAAHLGSRLIVVMGHENCGAIQSSLLTEEEVKGEPQELRDVLTTIRPGIAAVPSGESEKERLSKSVEANVRANVHKLMASPGMAALIQKNAIQVVAAVYDLKTGQVRVLSEK